MRAPGVIIAGIAALLSVAPALAADPIAPGVSPVPPAFSATGRPRIGLVLGGGGAKGFAHIGVIAELERRRIPIDVIAGTSMGAVVGSMYAIGNDGPGIERIARAIDWVTVFDDATRRSDLSFRRKREVRDILLNFRLRIDDGRPVLPSGVLGGQRLFAAVQELLAPWRATENFNDLPIPYRAVATDIVTGKTVVMGDGNLSTAVFASMSIPAALPPVERQGQLLVDGGISDNLPVDVARAMGVDIVIVVDVGEPPATADKLDSAISVVNQMQILLGYDAVRQQREALRPRDVLIEPDITGFGVTAFGRLEDGIARGRAAAQKMGDRLAALSVSDAQWAVYLSERDARSHPPPIRIASVEIVNGSRLKTEDLQALVRTRPGHVLDGKVMAADVASIYALDEFERVDYRVDPAPAGNVLVVNTSGLRGSGRYFQSGLLLASNFGKASTFDLAIAYTNRNFLGTGAEWRGFGRVGNDVLFDVSLYRQVGNLFAEPIAFYQRASTLATQLGSNQANLVLQAERAGAGIDGGLVFGNWGELRIGTRIGGINPIEDDLQVDLPRGWTRDVEIRAGFTVDTYDSLTFPRSGTFAQLQYVDHVTALGGRFTRNNVSIAVNQALSRGKATLVLTGRLGTTTDRSRDFIGDYQLGGFLNLSGLTRNSLIGPQLLFGRAVGYYRLTDRSPILDLPIYLGGSLEAGNVWDERRDISLGDLRTAVSGFIAADTILGPVFLGLGQSGGNGSIYLGLGRIF